MQNLSNRCIIILQYLLEQTDYITSQEIADQLGVSIRTIRYDIEQIKDWANINHLNIEVVQKKGILMSNEVKEKVSGLLSMDDNSDYFFSSEERVSLLVSALLSEDILDSIEVLAEKYLVSKNTMLRDLDHVEEWFDQHGASLLRRQRKGVYLNGDERERRRLMVEYLEEQVDTEDYLKRYFGRIENNKMYNSEKNPITYNIFKMNPEQQISELWIFLRKNGFSSTDTDFVYLSLFYLVQNLRIQKKHYVTLDPVKTGQDHDLLMRLINEQHLIAGDQNLAETDYLASIMSAYMNTNIGEDDAAYTLLTDEIYHYLVLRIHEIENIDLSDDQEFRRSLRLHLNSMINRLRLNIPYSNVLLDQIKSNYRETYVLTDRIFDEIQNKFHLEKNEDEVGYITLYVNLALQQKRKKDQSYETRVLLVCSQGLATTSFLSRAIQEEFRLLKIVDKIPANKAIDYDCSDIDLILTTIDLPFTTLKPCIKVNPMLTRTDISRISRFLTKQDHQIITKVHRIDEIMEVVRQYCNIQDEKGLKTDLIQLFTEKEVADPLPNLMDVLKKEYFICGIEAYDWEDAVVQAAEPMINNKAINASYLSEIFELKETYNQYAIITNGICMPHASPNPNNKLAMSLATLKNPITIRVNPDEDPIDIYVIMVLAINDSTRCAKALDEIFTIFNNNPDFAFALHKANNAREIADIISQCYDKIS